MSDTPITDSSIIERRHIHKRGGSVELLELLDANVSRKLERERNEAIEALRILFKDYKELADSGDAGFWELEDKDAAQPALRILQQMEDATQTTKHEQVSSKLARYKEDAEVVTKERDKLRDKLQWLAKVLEQADEEHGRAVGGKADMLANAIEEATK